MPLWQHPSRDFKALLEELIGFLEPTLLRDRVGEAGHGDKIIRLPSGMKAASLLQELPEQLLLLHVLLLMFQDSRQVVQSPERVGVRRAQDALLSLHHLSKKPLGFFRSAHMRKNWPQLAHGMKRLRILFTSGPAQPVHRFPEVFVRLLEPAGLAAEKGKVGACFECQGVVLSECAAKAMERLLVQPLRLVYLAKVPHLLCEVVDAHKSALVILPEHASFLLYHVPGEHFGLIDFSELCARCGQVGHRTQRRGVVLPLERALPLQSSTKEALGLLESATAHQMEAEVVGGGQRVGSHVSQDAMGVFKGLPQELLGLIQLAVIGEKTAEGPLEPDRHGVVLAQGSVASLQRIPNESLRPWPVAPTSQSGHEIRHRVESLDMVVTEESAARLQ